jgi:hypothetical protein
VRVKAADASTDSWFTVTRTATLNEYATVYAGGDDAVTYPAGSVATDYGQSGQGYLLLTADLSGAPFYSVRTHDGEPWTTENEVVRLGNLNGAFGITTDTPGLGIGNSVTGDYLLGTEEGLQLVSGGGAVGMDNSGVYLLLSDSEYMRGTYQFRTSLGATLSGISGLLLPYSDPIAGLLQLRVFADASSVVYNNVVSRILLETKTYDSSSSMIDLQSHCLAGGGPGLAKSTQLVINSSSDESFRFISTREAPYAYFASDLRVLNGLYVGDNSDPPDDAIIADGYIRGLELRLPASLRISEFASGTDTYPNLYRNAYYTGSEWKRVFADQDATILSIGADGTFKVLHATDTNDTADSAITWAERFRVSEVGRTSVHMLNLAGVLPGNALTIASDAITVTGSFHTVDTEGGASSDSLATINGGSFGD